MAWLIHSSCVFLLLLRTLTPSSLISLASSTPSPSTTSHPSSSDDETIFPFSGHTPYHPLEDHPADPEPPLQPESKSPKQAQILQIHPHIPFDQVQPFSKSNAFAHPIDVRTMRRQLSRDLNHPQRRDFRKRILFFSVTGNNNQLGRIVKKNSLVPYASLFGRSYAHLMELLSQRPNSREARYELAQRFNVVAAQIAEGQAYFLVSSEKDARNPVNVWNMYARPTLQGRGIPIVWLDGEGNRRGSVYPDEVIAPPEGGDELGAELDQVDMGKRLQLKGEGGGKKGWKGVKGRGKGRRNRRDRRSIELGKGILSYEI